MSTRQLLLVLLNVFLLGKFFVPLAPLALYLGIGYLVILHVHVQRTRGASPSRLAQAVPLACWFLAWQPFRPGVGLEPLRYWLERTPMIGLMGLGSPTLVGASYVFLKVYDLIRRVQRGESPPGVFAYLLQTTFLPSFVAGPIAGPEAFAWGFRASGARFAAGLNRLLVAVLKLYVLAPLVDPMNLLGSTEATVVARTLAWSDLYTGVVASALGLYLNFSGYSDVAIGAGLLVGIKLPENFDAPYLAGNPSEFWQRWHMSFTAWLREHVFSPVSRLMLEAGLGGSVLALVASSTATMVLCGLWHRMNLDFLIWGLYHAFFVVAHQLWATRLRPRLGRAGFGRVFATPGYRVVCMLLTFHVIAVGWILMIPLDAPLAGRLELLRRFLFPW